jgi:hypothetical protein
MRQSHVYHQFKCYQPVVAQGSTRGNTSHIRPVTAEVTKCYQNAVTHKMTVIGTLRRMIPLLPQTDIDPTLKKNGR